MKKFDEEENEDFCEDEYFNFLFGEEEIFWKNFCGRCPGGVLGLRGDGYVRAKV